MDFDCLPHEILNRIISFIDIKGAKSLSQTSKQMHELALSRIWSKPSFAFFKNLEHLKKISKFPIKELRTGPFKDCSLVDFVKTLPQLNPLHVSTRSYFDVEEFDKVTIPMILYTDAIKFSTQRTYFDQILTILSKKLPKNGCSLKKT